MVTTNRVGYGTTFGRAGGDRGLTREVSWFDKREPKTRLVSERSTKARGERGNYDRMHVFKNKDGNECRCNANDAIMNATHKINNRADTQNMERIWSVGLGALQG